MIASGGRNEQEYWSPGDDHAGMVNSGLLGNLTGLVDSVFGRLNAAACLLILIVALSSRTRYGISARCVGRCEQETDLAEMIRQLVGKGKAFCLTQAKKTTLADVKRFWVNLVVVDCSFVLPSEYDLLRWVVKRKRVYYVVSDGGRPSQDWHTYDHTMILLDAEKIEDPYVVKYALTVPFKPDQEHLRRIVYARVSRPSVDAPASPVSLEETAARLNAINWLARAEFEDIEEVRRCGEVLRDSAMVQGFVSVAVGMAFLRVAPDAERQVVTVSARDVALAIKLLQLARVPHPHSAIRPVDMEFLSRVQQFARDPKHSPFTRYDLHLDALFGDMHIATIDDRLHHLADAGLIERSGKDGRRIAYVLSSIGQTYEAGLLTAGLSAWSAEGREGEVQGTAERAPVKLELATVGEWAGNGSS